MASETNSPTRDLVVTYIEDHPKAILLLRAARRRAQERGLAWRAVFIETPAQLRAGDKGSHERVLRLLTLAQQMGGETVHIEAARLEEALESFLEKEGGSVALSILGKAEAEGRFKKLRALSWMHSVRLASQYAPVEIIPLSGHYRRSLAQRFHLQSIRPLYLLYALLAVGVAYLGALGLEWILPPALFRINDRNVGLLFMIACAFVAGRYGLLPGLVASLAGFLLVNFYFTVPYPYHALHMGTVTDMLNMGLFLSAALLISLFASQTRGYAQRAAKRELSTQALFTLYRVTSDAATRAQALEDLQRKLENMLDVDVAFFLPPALDSKRIEPAFSPGPDLAAADQQALNLCWSDMKTTGAASPSNPNALWRFEPMVSTAGEIGVMGVKPRHPAQLDIWFGRLLTAIADQTATALDHIELEHSIAETRLREEREKLRSMLLSSVSHDLKTPLAGIIGALSVHRSLGARLAESKRNELIDSAIEEAQRLDSFITNILDMTRLESGNIQFNKEWYRISDIIGNIVKRLHHRCRLHSVSVKPLPEGIEVFADMMMTEQVFQNLLDNACKYTPPGTGIEISCHVVEGKGVLCEVRDHGPGLPPEKIQQAFDKYARLQKKDSQVAGTGLGLAISRAVMEVQGGWITAENHPEGGAIFTLCLAQWRKAGTKEEITANPRGTENVAGQQAHSRH